MSSSILKIIACLAMLIDHTGAMLMPYTDVTLMRAIGRMAFPMFAYFVAIGATKTSNLKKYMLRLLVFALITEIPFDLLFENVPLNQNLVFVNLDYQNVMFTFFLAVACIYVIIKFDNFAKYILGAFILSCAGFFSTDYGIFGALLVVLLYFFKDNRLTILAFFVLILYWASPIFLAFGMLSVLLLYFYNGKRGNLNKWVFYLFYPLHLFILSIINILLGRLL